MGACFASCLLLRKCSQEVVPACESGAKLLHKLVPRHSRHFRKLELPSLPAIHGSWNLPSKNGIRENGARLIYCLSLHPHATGDNALVRAARGGRSVVQCARARGIVRVGAVVQCSASCQWRREARKRWTSA